MPRLYGKIFSVRLTRESTNTLDDITTQLGLPSRRVAIELLSRFAKKVSETTGTTFESLLLKDTLPTAFDRRYKQNGSNLSKSETIVKNIS